MYDHLAWKPRFDSIRTISTPKMWSWFVVLVCWLMPMPMICRCIVTWMLVLNRLICCNDSEIVLILLVDGCPRTSDGCPRTSHQKRNWFDFTVVKGNLALLRMTLCFLAVALPQFTLLRDLGVMLDSNMTMSQHVLRVCQNCYFQLWLIRRLGKALSVESKLF